MAWQDNSGNEDGFRITRTRLSDNTTRTIEVGADVAYFYDGNTDLTPGATYRYDIVAYNEAGSSMAATAQAPAAALPTVTIQAIDPSAAEAGPNPGRWVVWQNTDYVERPLSVNLQTTPTPTDGGYALSPALPALIPVGYYGAVVQLDPTQDDTLDPAHIVHGSVAAGARAPASPQRVHSPGAVV